MQDAKTTLELELDEIRTQIEELGETLSERPDYGLGKGDPAAARQEVDHALLQRLRQRAKSLEQALSRLSQGSYGICVRCQRPIHPVRCFSTRRSWPNTRIWRSISVMRKGER